MAEHWGVTTDQFNPPNKVATPKSAKKVARLEDALAPAAASSSSSKKGASTTLAKVLACGKFELRDAAVPGGHPFFQSSSMETSAKVRECYAKNLPKVAEEGQRKSFWTRLPSSARLIPAFRSLSCRPFSW